MRKFFLFLLLFSYLLVHSQDTNRVFIAVENPPEPICGESVYYDWVKEKSDELKNKYFIKCEDVDSKAIYIGFIVD